MAEKCCEIENKVDKNYQMLKEHEVEKKKKNEQNYDVDNKERFTNLENKFTKMEENNIKIVKDLENKNEIIND